MLTELEANELARLLRKVKFPLPPEVWDAYVENFPHIAIEMAIIRHNLVYGERMIFLTQRSPADKFWPSEWHIPGTVIRHNETTSQACHRLINTEADGQCDKIGGIRQIETFNFTTGEGPDCCRRGHGISILYTATFSGYEIPGGTFFPLTELPKLVIPHHRTMIQRLILAL